MNKYLRISESANSFFQNAVLSTIFVFKSNIYQIGSLFEKNLAPILFPLVIIPDAIASLFAIYRFARAKNKNLGKTFDLIHAPIKAALVFTAVFAGLSLIFVQGLFLAAVGSGLVYHLGLSIFHAYHWFKSEKKSPARTLHKNHTINNLIATMIGGVVIAGIILTMVVAPYLAATILAMAGITAAMLLMLTTVFAIYRNCKNPPVFLTIDPTPIPEQENPETFHNHSASFNHSTSRTFTQSSDVVPGFSHQSQNSNYYYRKFRLEKLTGNQEEDKKFLQEEIKNKKESLQQQIASSKNTFFGRVWSEELKRQAKIDFLNRLEAKIEENDASPLSIPNGAFQSFYKEKSAVQNIYQITKLYFQNIQFI